MRSQAWIEGEETMQQESMSKESKPPAQEIYSYLPDLNLISWIPFPFDDKCFCTCPTLRLSVFIMRSSGHKITCCPNTG